MTHSSNVDKLDAIIDDALSRGLHLDVHAGGAVLLSPPELVARHPDVVAKIREQRTEVAQRLRERDAQSHSESGWLLPYMAKFGDLERVPCICGRYDCEEGCGE